jgi:hypothetical protein
MFRFIPETEKAKQIDNLDKYKAFQPVIIGDGLFHRRFSNLNYNAVGVASMWNPPFSL